MGGSEIKPSSRLVRAAQAERRELARSRERLAEKQRRLRAELQAIDAGLEALTERERLLSSLTATGADIRPAPASHEPSPSPEPSPGRSILRGPEIRERAVALALARGLQAMHYREWYARLVEAGYEVAGKEPLAVFLTQLGRSPLVRKSTQPGVYEIDRQAQPRLERRLAELQAGLTALTRVAPGELAGARMRREDLMTAIRQTERALEEAQRVRAAGPPDPQQLHARGIAIAQ